MTPFQWITLASLAAALLWELIRIRTGRGPWRQAAVRGAVWTMAAIAIAKPELLQWAARAIGIQRGADLVFYVMALAFVATSFFLYARYIRLQCQITELVRELAILEARRTHGLEERTTDRR
ncbi:MAG: DUF2304 domain-containing protein [Pirellulales bacterium]